MAQATSGPVRQAVMALLSCDASEGAVMTEVTPERQALRALGPNLPRGDLPVAESAVRLDP